MSADSQTHPADDGWVAAVHAAADDFEPVGCGVVLDEWQVLTCAHVIKGQTEVWVFSQGRRGRGALPSGEDHSPGCRDAGPGPGHPRPRHIRALRRDTGPAPWPTRPGPRRAVTVPGCSGSDGTVRVWDPERKTSLLVIPVRDAARSVAYSGGLLVVGTMTGLLAIRLRSPAH